jgi:hypothetical protein
MTPDPFPRSLAIAGAWGYIGRKFLDVALAHGLETTVLDPGPAPADVDLSRVRRVATPEEFARTPAEVFHLAVHPEHRRLDLLLARGEPLVILVEKPMAAPGDPDGCCRVIAAVAGSPAIVLYDFPELYDPLTARVKGHLRSFRELRLTGIELQRSKDREDPSNPRNFKRMVDIQYQETVHCLAWVLDLLGGVGGGLEDVLDRGVRLEGESARYAPPNPGAYPHPVDGRCRYRADFGGVPVAGLTDFTRGAPWAKRRVVRGVGDGTPFTVEVSYLEGAKSLRIDGQDRPCDPEASSYEAVLATLARWVREHDREALRTSRFPHPSFAHATYQLSAALWRSCRDGRAVGFDSADALRRFDAHAPR